MENTFYRKQSLERITSPEELNEYLRVTRPSVWLILAAIILLLAGMLLWSSQASIESFATGTAQVEDGRMIIQFDNEQVAESVESGMTVIAGEAESRISSVGIDPYGEIFALAPTDLKDGRYSVRVVYRQTQVLSLLFS